MMVTKLFYHIQHKIFKLNEKKCNKRTGRKNWRNFGIALCGVKFLNPVKIVNRTASIILSHSMDK